MSNLKSPDKIFGINGKNCMFEVTASGLPIDKAVLHFFTYDPNKPAGNRVMFDVTIYLDIFEAARLANDILNGRIPKLADESRKQAKEQNSKYPRAVWTHQGGTPSSRTANGTAIAREFNVVPGAVQPWVLEAKQGKARETKEGLIVMDGKPDAVVRVPASNEALKEFALALNSLVRIWEQAKYIPLVQTSMADAIKKQKDAIENAKNSR